jgi:hypothetical protein
MTTFRWVISKDSALYQEFLNNKQKDNTMDDEIDLDSEITDLKTFYNEKIEAYKEEEIQFQNVAERYMRQYLQRKSERQAYEEKLATLIEKIESSTEETEE